MRVESTRRDRQAPVEASPALPAQAVEPARPDFRQLTPRDVLGLQRAIGNQSLARILARMERDSSPERSKGGGHGRGRGAGKKKVRGGHRGEHALPQAMQHDPDYAAWYHGMKQKRAGWLGSILGQEVSPDFNLDSKGEKKLRPHYEEWRKKHRPARDERAEEPESESDGSDEESEDWEDQLAEIEKRAVTLRDAVALTGASRARFEKNLGDLIAMFLDRHGHDEHLRNKLEVVRRMFDIPDRLFPD